MKTSLTPAVVIAGALLLAGAASAEPFPKADPNAGRKLFDEAKCAACHAQRFGGDGSGIFTRADRKIKSPESLAAQITRCSVNLGLTLFPEDEENIGAYLNKNYYKFK